MTRKRKNTLHSTVSSSQPQQSAASNANHHPKLSQKENLQKLSKTNENQLQTSQQKQLNRRSRSNEKSNVSLTNKNAKRQQPKKNVQLNSHSSESSEEEDDEEEAEKDDSSSSNEVEEEASDSEDFASDSYENSSSELEFEDEDNIEQHKQREQARWNELFDKPFNQHEDEDSEDSAGELPSSESDEEAADEAEDLSSAKQQKVKLMKKKSNSIIVPIFDKQNLDSDTDSGNESGSKTTVTSRRTKRKTTQSAKQQISNRLAPTKQSGELAQLQDPADDEYKQDSSDEEDLRNTIGNVPINLYDKYDHVGYDQNAKKIPKPKQDDEIDNFLNRMDDPNYFRTVYDSSTGEKVVLDDNDLEILRRIRKGKYPDPSYDPYPDHIDFFSYEQELHPVTNHPLPKAHFIPSLSEKKLINKLVMKIRQARRLPQQQRPKQPERGPVFNFDLWEKEIEPNKWYKRQILTNKAPLPGHAESYNPPPEYLLTEEERAKWERTEPEKRNRNFLPQKFDAMRKVPQYSEFIKERFERCLELYLAPRSKKKRQQHDAEDLLPNLPRPSELRPYPTRESLAFVGHTGCVNSISIERAGQFVASGSLDGTVRVWEVITGRCLTTIDLQQEVKCVAWCPNKSLLLVNCDQEVLILNPMVCNKQICEAADAFISAASGQQGNNNSDVEWRFVDSQKDTDKWNLGVRVIIRHKFSIAQITWHHKGDYFASVMPKGHNKSVVIHQLSKRASQIPFRKSKGLVQRVLFHPSKPFFFVATERYVRIYNLVKQELTKKLQTHCRHLSSMAVHPKGDNLLVGSYDRKLNWFDLDMSGKPYKNLKYHGDGIRQVTFHPNYPLFASCSNDGKIIVSHGMVYDDLLQNALIVPVKTLYNGNQLRTNKSVMDCVFHPLQPWIVTAGEDSIIRLFS